MTEPSVLDELIARIGDLNPDEREALARDAFAATGEFKFLPNEGPQTMAYYSDADVLLYGGQAGGGKSALLLGLAFNEHVRALIIRRRSADLSGLIDEAIKFNGTRRGYSGAPPKSLRIAGDDEEHKIEFGGCPHLGDEQAWQGRPRDFLGLEEGAQLLEAQARFLMGWVRSTRPGQRCRTVIASNPPLTDEGQWLFRMFRPWLDRTYRNPARPGELRWYVVDTDNNDIEVEGPGRYEIGVKRDGTPNTVTAQSRTFIPAALDDNPYLRDTNYRATLDSLPEPLRSAMRDGDWESGRIDDPAQVIPTAWIYEAQNRWTESPPETAPMTSIGVDVARGGTDETVLAPRYGWWFAPLIAVPGRETPLGTDVAGLVIKHRRNASSIVIDMGGGYGGAPYEHLKQNLEGSADGEDRIVFGFNGANATAARTNDRELTFYNRRAEVWWKFREALDPDQQGGSPVALPPDHQLVADLVSPRFTIEPRGIKIESKDDIVERLGRSPDRGDAVVMAWAYGAGHTTHGQIWRDYARSQGGKPKINRSYSHRKRKH